MKKASPFILELHCFLHRTILAQLWVPTQSPEENDLEGLWLIAMSGDSGGRSDRKSTCLKADGKQLLASEGLKRGHGLGEKESDSASGPSAGLMWDKLPAEHTWRSQMMHASTLSSGRTLSKDSTWATQTRAKIFTAQNTFPNSRKSSSHVLAAARALQLSLINVQ